MTDYRIVPARPLHAGSLVRRLDPAERRRAVLAGIDPRRRLRDYIRQSVYARAALLDGHAVVLWGLKAGLLDETALVWLAATPAAARHFVSFGREARAEVAAMCAQGRELRSFVPADDRGGLRFLDFLGFEATGVTDGVVNVRRQC